LPQQQAALAACAFDPGFSGSFLEARKPIFSGLVAIVQGQDFLKAGGGIPVFTLALTYQT